MSTGSFGFRAKNVVGVIMCVGRTLSDPHRFVAENVRKTPCDPDVIGVLCVCRIAHVGMGARDETSETVSTCQ